MTSSLRSSSEQTADVVRPASTCHTGKRPVPQRSFRPCVTWRIGVSCHPALSGALLDRISWGGSMRLRPIPVLVLAVPLAVVSLANRLNAQTTTSRGLTGVVSDPSHALVPDAGVEISDSAKGTTQSTKTDREGVYRFFFLAPERYTLTVTHAGFRKESRMANVLLGPPVTVNVTLELASERTTVNVAGEAPLIQSGNGDVSTTMNQQQIAEVPNPGGDITYVAKIAPGAVMNTDQSGLAYFSILGMPGTSNLFFLDGMSENDNGLNLNLVGSLNMLLGQNQIQEATVVSTGYSGQFGGAAGANINFITKSGSNQFHGNAQYYWNGRAFNANDWFNNAKAKGGRLILPINGLVLWVARFKRISCSFSSIAKAPGCSYPRISSWSFQVLSLKSQPSLILTRGLA